MKLWCGCNRWEKDRGVTTGFHIDLVAMTRLMRFWLEFATGCLSLGKQGFGK
ncbi:hypothetical protein Hanom_Chr08g00693431 [Helianthus anomalus]